MDKPKKPPHQTNVNGKELCALTGAALVAYGLWEIYRPLMFLWAGGVLLFAVWLTLPVPRKPD